MARRGLPLRTLCVKCGRVLRVPEACPSTYPSESFVLCSLLRALVCPSGCSIALKPCVGRRPSSALAEEQPSVGMAVASQDIQLTVVFERFGAPQLLLVLNCLLTEQKIVVRIAAACIVQCATCSRRVTPCDMQLATYDARQKACYRRLAT